MLTVIAVGLITFCAMEFVAYASHRFIMHGLLWCWHRSHHGEPAAPLYLNDLFVLVPALTSFCLILYGTVCNSLIATGLGFGMVLYGLSYLIFHEMIVHKRFVRNWRPRNRFIRKLVHAHLVHHSSTTKDGCVNFGFFIPDPIASLRADAEPRRARSGQTSSGQTSSD